MEIGSDGKVSWSCDSTTEPKQIGGAGTSSLYGVNSKPLSKPLVAQKFSGSDYLVVDSGNDRVIRIDRGGQVMWSCTQFVDGYKNLLRSGESKTLKSPADAKMWSEYEKIDGKWFYITHCLIADSGNFRILDIVDRFNSNASWQILDPVIPDADGRPVHELNWVSYTTYKDKHFTFNSVQMIRGMAEIEGKDALVNQIWASVSNYGLGTASDPIMPSSTGGGQLGGAIISMKYRESTAPYEWRYVVDGTITGQLTTLQTTSGTPIVLSGPTYFEVIDSTVPELLICDSTAVYKTSGPGGIIDWMFTANDYRNLPRKLTNGATGLPIDPFAVPIPFTPQRAQILPGGDLLVVNSYAGRSYDPQKSKFTGEILQVRRNSGGKPFEMIWYTPDMWWEPFVSNALPPGPDGQFVQKMKNAPNLDQPTCVQKLY
jgi:hypothetical protein